jgi:hypothetical protein
VGHESEQLSSPRRRASFAEIARSILRDVI